MTIIIPKSLFRGIDREHLRLLDTACKATETNTYFSLTTPLTGCNTTRRHSASTFVYSNTVLEIPVAAKDVITRVRELEIQFSCFYSKYGVVSSAGWKPNNRKLVFSDEGKGNFTLSLNMFPDKRFFESLHEGWFSCCCDTSQTSFLWGFCYIKWQAAVNHCRSMFCHTNSEWEEFFKIHLYYERVCTINA